MAGQQERHGKWTKPLLRPDNPRSYAKSDDPTTWGTYEQAVVAYKAGLCDGIGFCLLGIDIGAFDLDKCRDPITGAIAPEAMAIVERAGSYTEITVSGTGLRVVGIGTGKPLQVKQKLPGCGVEVESYRNSWRSWAMSSAPMPRSTCRPTTRHFPTGRYRRPKH
jgi:primase-polymerase (primpol)-like protein